MDMKERIRHLCKLNHVSMNKVEGDLGFGKGYLSKLGTSKPNAEKLKKIADYFNVSVEYLITGKEPKEESSNQGYYIDEETAKTAQEIYNNDKILFDVYKTADKDRLIAYAKKLSELRKLEEGEE